MNRVLKEELERLITNLRNIVAAENDINYDLVSDLIDSLPASIEAIERELELEENAWI